MLLVSSIVLSACSVKDQVKTKVIDKVVEVQDKVNNKIDQKVAEEKAETMTDEELLKELGTDDTSLDADLKALESDLQ